MKQLEKCYSAVFFGALLCVSAYGTFFAKMEGRVDCFGTSVSSTTLIRAECAMCLIVCSVFLWQMYREAKNK